MKLELKIFEIDTHAGRRFRFAIFDSDKPGGYPRNFVCLLPSRVSEAGEPNNIFQSIFGNKGVEQAKRLLTEALKKATNVEIKSEVERRLELLNPKTGIQIKCGSRGDVVAVKRTRSYSR